jgi:hypothetical protein
MDIKDDLQSILGNKGELFRALGLADIVQENVLGPFYYGIIVCMSHNLALQTKRELTVLRLHK